MSELQSISCPYKSVRGKAMDWTLIRIQMETPETARGLGPQSWATGVC